MVAAFAIVQGPRVIHNLPKWHWEDGRHFHHNRQHVHSIADCFLVPSAWEGGAESTYRPLSANLYYLAGRSGTAPFVVLADRLFIRYTYFGHAAWPSRSADSRPWRCTGFGAATRPPPTPRPRWPPAPEARAPDGQRSSAAPPGSRY